MMRRLFLPVTLGLVVATSALGQVTSPSGFLSTEGATDHSYILGQRLGLTWQPSAVR
jgi:hypothetical protein